MTDKQTIETMEVDVDKEVAEVPKPKTAKKPKKAPSKTEPATAKRHQKKKRPDIEMDFKRGSIKKLIKQGGIARSNEKVIAVAREIIMQTVTDIMRGAVLFMGDQDKKHHRKTLCMRDVEASMISDGKAVFYDQHQLEAPPRRRLIKATLEK